ncbi:hypothetical protein JCM8547_009174 [Rhodosporidiobolus lusitaniae]
MLALGAIFALVAAHAAHAAPTYSHSSFSSSSLATAQLAASSSSSSVVNGTYTAALKADGFTSDVWQKAFGKAREVVSQLTLAEKVNFTDLPDNTHGCAGQTFPIERFNISGICFADGPTGLNTRYTTQFPTEVTTAATWDRSLFTTRAEEMAKQYVVYGVNTPLSIVAGPMGRSPWGGRDWENWSPDPVLTAEATRLTVEGFQKHGVTGLVKHFFGNEQEHLRIGNPYGGYFGATENQTLGIIVDDATVRELYAWPFADAIRSGAGGIMCSYNAVDGTLACENDEVLNKLLKEELNFPGAVITDWTAAHNTLGAALNGSDYVESNNLFGALLEPYLTNGTIPESVLDDKLIRWLTPYYALDQASLPEPDFTRWAANDNATAIVRQIAEESITLLKNVRGDNETRGLPLVDPVDLILVGSAAGPGPFGAVSNLAGAIYYNTDIDYPGAVTDGFGSGGAATPYVVDPLQGITARGLKHTPRPVVVDGYLSNNPNATNSRSVIPGTGGSFSLSFLDNKLSYASSTVVFVSATGQEGYDRRDLKLQLGGDDLILYTADRHNDTIVVITAPGPVDMSAWIDHENVTSVLYTYFPTVEGGNAIASVLFGDVNPSGKLPFTIAQSTSEYDAGAYYNESVSAYPMTNFSEGVFIDYKYFDREEKTPLYEFGFGLSYTNFSTSDIKVSATQKTSTALVRETNEKYLVNGTATSGLYDIAYTVEATVANTGSLAGAEVVQLYLTFPSSTPREMPIRSLRGFAKEKLEAGATATVSFELRNKDLAYYDIEQAGWVVPKGDFTVSVGSSSRNLPLDATLTV